MTDDLQSANVFATCFKMALSWGFKTRGTQWLTMPTSSSALTCAGVGCFLAFKLLLLLLPLLLLVLFAGEGCVHAGQEVLCHHQ
jgi:hypothetical protein